MRGNKKYTITFQKKYKSIGYGKWLEVEDSFICKVLSALSEVYDFQIIKIRLKDCFGKSYIQIKCNRNDKNKIFLTFCEKLDGEIEEINF